MFCLLYFTYIDVTEAVKLISRPLPAIGRFLTHILQGARAYWLHSYLVKHDHAYNMALGKMSCEKQLSMLVEDLARYVSAGKQTDLIMLAFSKAFHKENQSAPLEAPPA